MSDAPEFALRDATPDDSPAIAKIYGYHVHNGLASFEDEAPSAEEMRARFADIVGRGLPWLVACAPDGRVLGYAYAGLYRLRSGYRYTLEDSIYVDPHSLWIGVGTALLTAVIARATALGYRQMVAVVGDSANVASIGLHARMGFRHAGVLPSTGFKFGRWVDSVLMQRPLGEGDTTLPKA